jgi:hypothetical protein
MVMVVGDEAAERDARGACHDEVPLLRVARASPRVSCAPIPIAEAPRPRIRPLLCCAPSPRTTPTMSAAAPTDDAPSVLTHRFARFNPFRGSEDEGGDEQGQAADPEHIAGGGHVFAGRGDEQARRQLRVSHALRAMLAQQGEIRESDVGGGDDETLVSVPGGGVRSHALLRGARRREHRSRRHCHMPLRSCAARLIPSTTSTRLRFRTSSHARRSRTPST